MQYALAMKYTSHMIRLIAFRSYNGDVQGRAALGNLNVFQRILYTFYSKNVNSGLQLGDVKTLPRSPGST